MTTTIEDLTPPRVTSMLADTLTTGRVTELTVTPVGTGQMAECWRLELSYDADGAGPQTLVAKLPSGDAASRAAAVAVRAYEIEVNFYRELLPGLAVHAPTCHHAEFDAATGDFVLLLADVALARQGDQLSGCSPDEAAAAVAELPGLHAPRWGDEALTHLDWLYRNTPDTAGFLGELIRGLYPGFQERYADRLSPDVARVSEQVVASIDTIAAERPRPWTVTHGDFRLDNLLFSEGAPVHVVDWQTCALGPGVGDLAYFLGGSLLPSDRRAHEESLVRDYQERMTALGVRLDWDELWRNYRRSTVGGLIMAIAASMMVKRTDRGDEMFLVMAERAGQHAVDLEAAGLLQ